MLDTGQLVTGGHGGSWRHKADLTDHNLIGTRAERLVMVRRDFMSEWTLIGLAIGAAFMASPASADSSPPRKAIVEIIAALRIGAFDCPGAIDGSLSHAALILMATANPPLRA